MRFVLAYFVHNSEFNETLYALHIIINYAEPFRNMYVRRAKKSKRLIKELKVSELKILLQSDRKLESLHPYIHKHIFHKKKFNPNYVQVGRAQIIQSVSQL